MSVKRQATSELNHENWDQEDPSEHEEMGTFKSAPKDILEKRVIRTAKRRVQASGDDAKKGGVFSGFGGFNKTQPSSFDFLANLTNGSKPTNGSATSKNDTSPSSSLFTSKPGTSSPSSGLFTAAANSSSTPKSTFGIPTSQPSLLFGAASSTAGAAPSPFAVSKTESAATSSPFKIQTSASTPATNTGNAFKSTGSALGSGNSTNKSSLFSSSSVTLSPFKTTNITTSSINLSTENTTDKKPVEKDDDKKLKYYAKLKGLNESVSDWIKKHVEETPLCILSPIFKDYEKYLKEIQDEYQGTKDEIKTPSGNNSKETTSSSLVKNIKETDKSATSTFSSSNKPSIFGSQQTSSSADKPAGFSFGINASNNNATTSAGFSFGVTSTPAATATSAFSLTTTTTGANGNAPFSFGIGKPFSFSSNIQKPTETSKEENDEEDEPPKVEYTPVVEEDSVFDKKCKIFVKKDGNFVDKGVGTLYIKKVEETGKHQLLVRANTNLGTVLLNLILSTSIPTQRLGKNNVMLACIPTPDAKPPPTPVLIRVKTSEEADDLLETLNKYKA